MSSAAKENSDQKGNALSDDEDEAVFDRAAIKRRAFAEPPAPHTPGEKGEKKISYAVDGIDAKKVDGSYQFNFQVENFEFKESRESITVPQFAILKVIVPTDHRFFECAFKFEDKEGTVSPTLTPGDSWYYICDTAGEFEFEDPDFDELGCLVTVEPIRDDDKAMQKCAEKARKRFSKWSENERKKKEKKDKADQVAEMKQKKKDMQYDEKYEKAAAKERNKSDNNFDFEFSEEDAMREQMVQESIEMYRKMKETKLQG
eukprot:g2744.t1